MGSVHAAGTYSVGRDLVTTVLKFDRCFTQIKIIPTCLALLKRHVVFALVAY